MRGLHWKCIDSKVMKKQGIIQTFIVGSLFFTNMLDRYETKRGI